MPMDISVGARHDSAQTQWQYRVALHSGVKLYYV